MRAYIVYVKSRRSDPAFVSQYVFAASVRQAIADARGQGFIVRDARLAA